MEKEQLILQSAQKYNILPLTSHCDAHCIFCSHRSNPAQIKVVSIPPRTMEEVERTLTFLDGSKKITIGESATCIIEGEPFSHPQFPQVLKLIRGRFPHTLISLTTNGCRISEEMADLLREALPLEINISLNSATAKGRKILMGDPEDQAQRAVKSIEFLGDQGIPFHGSIVAMPHVVGWQDLRETISFLSDRGALTIRVFMAGFGNNAHPLLKFNPEKMHRELADFLSRAAETTDCPILLEPPVINDLKPVMAGVIKGSKADLAGMKRGDFILEVNHRKPRSRVEAWQFAQKPGNVLIKAARQGRIKEFTWYNTKKEKAGLVMEYDFDMARWDQIKEIVHKFSGPVLILCSELARHLFEVLEKSQEHKGLIEIEPVKNNLFGGSIGAAGLLTVDDFYIGYLKYRKRKEAPELMLLPAEAFDYLGRDLTGHLYSDLEEKTGVRVMII